MAKKKSTPKTRSSDRAPKPQMWGADWDDAKRANDILKEIERLRRRHAAAIIACGLTDDGGPHWEDVLYSLAEDRTAKDRAELRAVLEQLERIAPDSTRLGTVREGRSQPESADECIAGLLSAWADIGFYLGVAVGQQLGPHAFDRGVR